MGTLISLIPRLRQSLRASVTLPPELYFDGMETPTTFSAPTASAAMAAVRAESIPPLIPSTTFSKPFFLT